MTKMYDAFRTDKDLERNGVVLDYGDFRVTVARAGGSNVRFATVLDAKSKPFRRAIQLEVLDNATAEKILMETYVDTVIRRWEVRQPAAEEGAQDTWADGIEGPDGELLPFTKENVKAALEALPDLFTDIKEQASKLQVFRQAVREAEAGN